MKKSHKILAVLFIAVFAAGVFLTCYSASLMIRQSYVEKNYVHNYAYVSHLKENDKGGEDYIIHYTADGEAYFKVYDRANSKTYIGETLDIYYPEGQPENYIFGIGKIYRYILAEGIMLTVFALIMLVLAVFPGAKKHSLVKKNKWAMCKVIRVKKLSEKKVKIFCDSSKFKKRKGKPFVTTYRGKLPKNIRENSLMVYYSEKNPNIYYVETDKLS